MLSPLRGEDKLEEHIVDITKRTKKQEEENQKNDINEMNLSYYWYDNNI